MIKKTVVLALSPQDLPTALRSGGLMFHQNSRTVNERPHAVIAPIDDLDDASVSAVRSWKAEGTIIIDFASQNRKSPLADSVLSSGWDIPTTMMRFSEAIHQFHPIRTNLQPQEKGMITPNDLAMVFLKLRKFQSTGALLCVEGRREHIFYFREGALFYVGTNVEGEHLGSYLVQKGKIKPNHFAIATKQFFSTGNRVGQCLVDTGVMTPETLTECLIEQQEAIARSTFEWEGGWQFYKHLPKLSADLNFPVNVPRVILNVLNRIKEYEAPSPLPWKETAMVSRIIKDVDALPLTPDQYYLLEQLPENPIEVRHLYSLLPPPEKQKDRTTFQLYVAGVIRIHTFDPIDEVVELAQAARGKTYYEILDVAPDADESAIRTRYVEMARKYHPDRFTGSERYPMVKEQVEMFFATINEAYQILSNPEERSEYDGSKSRVQDLQQRPDEKITVLMKDVRKAVSDKNYSLALQKLNEIVYLGRKTAEVYRLMGQCQLQDPNRLKDAEVSLRKSLELDKENADTHFLLAQIYLKAGMKSRAQRHLAETVRLQPGHYEADILLKGLNE